MTKDKIKKILIICMILTSICVYPLCLIRKERILYPTLGVEYGRSYSNVQKLEQTFIAQTDYLSEIAFDIAFPNGKPEEGSLSIALCKNGGVSAVIAERHMLLQEINNAAFTYLPIEKHIQKGELYAIVIVGAENVTAEFTAIYTEEEQDAALGSQTLYLNGKKAEGQAVIAYSYGFPLNWKNVLCLWSFIGIVGLMLIETLTGDICGKKNKLFDKINEMLDKYQIFIFLVELAVVFFMLIRIARNEAVDWDEAYTWRMVTKNSFFTMLKMTAADVHPPLYYALVMAAMKIFGENIFVGKMVSVAGWIATAVLGITQIRKRWGVKVTVLFLPVTGLAPQMIYYNLNLRMYSWMIFFVLASVLFAYEIMLSGRIKWWIGFILTSLGGVYTQYFAVVPLAFTYLFLLIYCIAEDREQIKKWIFCSIATVAGYVPWLGVVTDMMKQDAASGGKEIAVNIGALCRWAFQCNIEMSEYMPAMLFLIAVFCFILKRKEYTEKEQIYLGFVGGVFFLSYGLCMLLQREFNHFWSERYVVDALLFIWLFLIINISRKDFRIWCLSVLWLGILMLSSYARMQEIELRTISWTTQAKQLLEQVQNEEKVVYNYSTYDTLYSYYLPNVEFIWYEDIDFNEIGEEFYMISWGGGDFNWNWYANGILEKERIGEMRLEEGVGGVELWKIKYHKPVE